MKELFNKCYTAEYIHTAGGGDYAIQYEDGTLYLLFEWSDGREDWKNNLDFPAKPYKRMSDTWHCHRGFLRVWKAMRDEGEENVVKNVEWFAGGVRTVERIVCVGYSHGAAIALLATEDMAFLYPGIPVKGYGFGCPRVLWGKVPEAVKQRLSGFVAVRNVPDLVTHVPPALFGFKHVNLLKVGKLGKYGPIKAHYASAYLEELKNHKTKE